MAHELARRDFSGVVAVADDDDISSVVAMTPIIAAARDR